MTNNQKNTPVLEFNNATAYRGDTKVIDDFSMTIGRLEHTAIIGPNGSGKSTFIQLLTHQLHPVSQPDRNAPIRVLGKNRWNVAELRKRIGIVSADLEYQITNNLKKGRLSGHEVAVSGFFSSMQLFSHHRVKTRMHQQADKMLNLMNASHLADQMFSKMSAGEARRVLIARALVTSPDALVLDEPTTSLDFVARHTCLKLISEIARQGTTVIIVTHHVEEIIPEVNNVILLRDGKALFSGTKERVLTSKKLSKLFNYPLELHQKGNSYRIEMNSF